LPDPILFALVNVAFLVLAACVNANTTRRRPIGPDPIPHAPLPGAAAPVVDGAASWFSGVGRSPQGVFP
jgi:hypothetical protein